MVDRFQGFQGFGQPTNQSFPTAPIEEIQALLAQGLLTPEQIAPSQLQPQGVPSLPVGGIPQQRAQGTGLLAPTPAALPAPTGRGVPAAAPAPATGNRLTDFGLALSEQDFKATGTSGAGDFVAGLLGGFGKATAARVGREKTAKQEKAAQLKFEQDSKIQNAKARKFEAEAEKLERQAASLASGGLGIDQEEVFKRATTLRKEFTNLSKDFFKQRDAFGRLRAAGTSPTAAGDLALIFNYMKILDPGSTVREGEFATAEQAGSVPDRIRARYNKITKGERLSANQREDFLDRSDKLFDSVNAQHNTRINTFTGLAKRQGVDPQNVAVDLSLAEQDAAQEEAIPRDAPVTPPTELPTINNQKDFDALPVGAKFIDDGKVFVK